jgi:hypothetical protein
VGTACGSTELKLHARSRLQALQGDGAVLFSLAAGLPAVFRKRFVFELIEDEMRTGESCLLVVGLSFEFVPVSLSPLARVIPLCSGPRRAHLVRS